MELKTWLLMIRVLNCISSALLIGFEVWYIVEMFATHMTFFGVMMRIWAPIFLILIALLVIVSEFKYQKILENFKFLQWLPGLALFNLFMGSILAFEFSTINEVFSIIVASIFAFLAIVFFVMNCFKPIGGRGLLSDDVGFML